MATYRPRGALSKALFEKLHNDASLNEFDQTLWYKMSKELPPCYQSRFVSFEQPDDITIQWLETAKTTSANLCLQLWHVLARFFLSMFMTQTDVNGILERGSMFILSENQFVTLLSRGGFQFNSHHHSGGAGGGMAMLDIGAGDGEITERVQKSVQRMTGEDLQVYVTETSWIMRKRLEKYQNFTVIEVPDVRRLSNLHLVTCLNVLDRCADPHQMLNDIHHILSPNGRALFALVLPYYHYVETNTSHLPVRPLLPHWPTYNCNSSTSGGGGGGAGGMNGDTCSAGDQCNYYSSNKRRPSFEDEARIFFEQLELSGFKVESWTKAPYLCEGDIRQSFYWLIDIVVVVSKV